MSIITKTQIERTLAHCEDINQDNMDKLDIEEAKLDLYILEEKLGNFYVNLGWIQALRFVLGLSTIPIKDSPLDRRYKDGYELLLECINWDSMDEEKQQSTKIKLKELKI